MKTPQCFTKVMFAAVLCSWLICFLGSCSTDDKGKNNVQRSPSPLAQLPSSTSIPREPQVIFGPPVMDRSAPEDTPRYSFSDAERKDLILAHVAGRGGSSGNSLIVTVQRRSTDEIDVYITPGTVFVPSGGNVQRMVAWSVAGLVNPETESLAPTTSMYLNTFESKIFLVEAYCLDFELENPAPQNAFRVDPVAYIRPAEIIQAGKSENASIATIQTAIWIDEDHVTKQEIQEKFNASDQEVEDAFELLKRTPRKSRK
jgi:hypothetical protein